MPACPLQVSSVTFLMSLVRAEIISNVTFTAGDCTPAAIMSTRPLSHSSDKDYQDIRVNSLSVSDALMYSKVHGANMGPIWGRQDPGGPHVPCYLGNFPWPADVTGIYKDIRGNSLSLSDALMYQLYWLKLVHNGLLPGCQHSNPFKPC